jgi:hypothetical protein
MRRHDYTVEILGGATGANYAFDYRDFQGIKVPMARRIFAYDENGQKVSEPILVSIDIAEVKFSSLTGAHAKSPAPATAVHGEAA